MVRESCSPPHLLLYIDETLYMYLVFVQSLNVICHNVTLNSKSDISDFDEILALKFTLHPPQTRGKFSNSLLTRVIMLHFRCTISQTQYSVTLYTILQCEHAYVSIPPCRKPAEAGLSCSCMPFSEMEMIASSSCS